MKIYQWLFLSGILLVLGALLIYSLSLFLVPDPVDNMVTNPLGNVTAVDSTVTASETLPAIAALMQHERVRLIWLALTVGGFCLIVGIIIKRRQEGPDRFLDDDEEDWE